MGEGDITDFLNKNKLSTDDKFDKVVQIQKDQAES